MDTPGHILYSVKAGAARITIVNPGRANSLTYPMIQQLAACWAEAAHDDDVYVAVLTGAGDRHFCAGADLNLVRSSDTPFEPGAQHNQTSLSLGFRKPVIAAVNGPAIGLGMQLAIDCDIIVASRAAYFLEPRTSFGKPPMGVLSLTNEVGFSELVRLGVGGMRLGAERAHALGIVSELADDRAHLDRITSSYVDTFAALPPQSVVANLSLLRAARRRPGVIAATRDATERIEHSFHPPTPTE